MIKIEDKEIELALYVIELKKMKLIKENKAKSFDSFKEKIAMLSKEKEEIYRGNEKIINKVLTEYVKGVTI